MGKIFTKAENQTWAHSLTGKMTSACMIMRSLDKVLMVKASYKDHWTFPSGIVEPFESPQTTAIRETHEETGIAIDSHDCRFFTVVYTAASKEADRDRFNFAFMIDHVSTDVALNVPNDEIEAAEWVDVSEVSKRSGDKASYTVFQQCLLLKDSPIPYHEVTD